MKKLNVIASESFQIENSQQIIPKEVMTKLYNFVAESYHIANLEEFQHLIIQPGQTGELTVLYGANDEVAGFSRTCRQSMAIGNKQVTTYVAYVYIDPLYRASPTVANTGLTQAINYKLGHPQEELIYVAFASNPATFEFIAALSDTIYPKATQNLPNQILTVITALKNKNGWISTHVNPLIVSSPLVPLRSQAVEYHFDNNELYNFYTDLNPDYMQGNALLVYMPLHLANINYGLNFADSNHECTPKLPPKTAHQQKPSLQ